jgi:VIT1/CCC1 family predicted Fe2+/Mn2+ transporter
VNQQPNESSAELQAAHTTEAIRARLRAGPEHSDLRDFIFGAIDGTVTNFAIISGVAGADLSAAVVIILGVANLVADGFSMGVSNYLGTRAEQQQQERTRRQEEFHVRTFPEGEREEIRQIFADKGFTGPDLERVVEVITSDQERWVNTMLREEHGYPAGEFSPWRAGLVTYIGFMIAGLVPLLPYFYLAAFPAGILQPFLWSIVLAGLTFFSIGAAKSRFVEQRWWWGGLETLLIGGVAAGLAYVIGLLLKGLVGVT